MLLLLLFTFIVIGSVVIILLVIDRGTTRVRLSLAEQQSHTEELAQIPPVEEPFAGKLIRTQDEERKRISRYLHDDIGQRLSLLAIELDVLCRCLATAGRDFEVDQVSRLKRLTDELTSDVHCLSDQLYSAKLQHLGLHSAVKELSKQVNKVSIKLNITQGTLLPPDVALCFFRVIQEALNNVVQHSNAENVSIDFMITDGTAHLRIADDGSGFDTSLPNSGLGLQGMRERLRMMGGQFAVDSSPGAGTLITASLPLKNHFDKVEPLLSDSTA